MLASMLGVFWTIECKSQNTPVSPIPVPPMPSNLLPGKKAPTVTDVWVIFKTHFDLGYTMSAEAVFKKYREDMMDGAIPLIEASRKKPVNERFKWTTPGWPMKAIMLGPLQTPERRQKIEQALREGALNVEALPASMESDVMEQEDYVRSLIFSSEIAREYGHKLPIAAKMTDVPAHSWLLPTLLHNAGVKFLQIGCNYTVQPMRLPQLFWWEGPDGSRILCNYTPHYGSDLAPPKNWPAKNYLAVMMSHDNEGPPSAKEVEQVLKGNSSMSLEAQINGWSGNKNAHDTTMEQLVKNKKVKIHFATLDDFANAILAEKPDLPVIRGDMVDPWIHGVMAMPEASKIARDIRPLEPALDIFNTQLKNWGISTSPLKAPLAKAYENSMLFSEHTFGAGWPGYAFFSADGKTNTLAEKRYLYNDAFVKARKDGFYEKFEASFRDKARYINITDSIVTNNFAARMKLLADNVKATAGDIIVYNPLPWVRSGVVDVNGEKMVAENVPANGYKVMARPKLTQTEKAKSVTTLNTTFYTVKFDTQKGGITSLIEKSTGKELVNQRSKYVLGQFLHERFSYDQTKDYHDRNYVMNNPLAGMKPYMPKDISYLATTLTDWSMTTAQSPTSVKVTLATTHASPIAQSVSISFTFPKAFAYVDVEWNIKNKTPNTVPEGGWLCFPFNVSNPKYILGRLGGAMDLSKDQIVGGNRHLYAVQSGASVVAPDGSGAGLCPIDAPLLSFGEPGLWKYDYDYFPKQPTVFVNLYNNMWNTNFPYWTEGSWSERVRIWDVQPGVKTTKNLAVQSWETRLPLIGVRAGGSGTKLPPLQKGISVSRKGVLVTAFGEDPDGNKGILLRVWEEAGVRGKLKVILPKGINVTKAIPVNLRGEKTVGAIEIASGSFEFDLGAYAPKSFILK